MRKALIHTSVIIILLVCVQCESYPNLDVQIAGLEKAIKDNPKNPEPYCELGMVYTSQHKYGRAKKVLKQAVKLNPNYAEAYNYLGYIYREEHDYDLAIEYYQKAISSDDKFMEPYIVLADIYWDQGIKSSDAESFKKAEEILELGLEKCDRTKFGDDCINILHNLSGLYLQDNNPNGVIRLAEQGLQLLSNEEDLKKYLIYSTDESKIHATRGHFYRYLGDAYRKLNKPEQALDAYNKALSEFRRIGDKTWPTLIEDLVKQVEPKQR